MLAEIASRYDDNAMALKILDNGIKNYFERKKNGKSVGSLETLYRYEYANAISIRTRQVLNGLESRVEEYLLGIRYEWRMPGRTKGVEEKI